MVVARINQPPTTSLRCRRRCSAFPSWAYRILCDCCPRSPRSVTGATAPTVDPRREADAMFPPPEPESVRVESRADETEWRRETRGVGAFVTLLLSPDHVRLLRPLTVVVERGEPPLKARAEKHQDAAGVCRRDKRSDDAVQRPNGPSTCRSRAVFIKAKRPRGVDRASLSSVFGSSVPRNLRADRHSDVGCVGEFPLPFFAASLHP